MNWTMANRLGHIAATKTHARLGVDVKEYPVNVSKAVDAAGLSLIRRPLPRLFGVYVEANGNRGVMVNANLTRATRRHTEGHELGHHELGHRPDPARDCAIDGAAVAPTVGPHARVGTQGQVEMTAEAFATWFLMPRRAVTSALTDLAIDALTSPSEVYRLSLLLGTTYRATCRHLVNIRLASRDDADLWARVQPGRLKRALATKVGVTLDSTYDVDVWDLRTASGARIEASVGDLLLLPDDLQDAVEAAGLAVAAADGAAVAVECTTATRLTRLVGAGWPLSLVVHDRLPGLYLPAEDPSLGEVELNL
ncbi:hypothetical protein QE364_000093 [Nocardioides zeae]|uniref:Uncharacterized protein n=1 Tax=Nocardioides zeae TaxID=1457234 RepID=A0ACC6ICM3_9ACTN|nr:hypothetical protein [Nocardioides zeae]MDR6208405.1 hypothetical protein [Nocardioides zeae]